MEFMQAVRARRSIRRFTPRPIPDEVLVTILDAGRMAPSAGGSNSFFFGVVRDESTRRALATAAGGQEWISTAPVVIALCARLGPDPATLPPTDLSLRVNVDRFGSKLLEHLAAFEDRTAARTYHDNAGPMIPGEHMALAAASFGLGSCWVGHLDIAVANRILNLPADHACLFLMPIGYPDEKPAGRTLRPIDQCVFYDRWSEVAEAAG
jgi:nitroreductase